jgi:hypothetical protein
MCCNGCEANGSTHGHRAPLHYRPRSRPHTSGGECVARPASSPYSPLSAGCPACGRALGG